MLRPFAHPVACYCVFLGVVASVCTPLPIRTQQLPTLLGKQCWETYVQTDATLLANNSQHCWMLGNEVHSHRAKLISNPEHFCAWLLGRSVSTGVETACKPRKEKVFLVCPTPYSWDRTTSNKSPAPSPKGRTCLRGCRGEGNRSNWTMNNVVLNVLHLLSSETLTCSYLSII